MAEAVLRSLLTLKALAHRETGGIVAAATTSLPEQLGGPRNWDYRFCWLRDATFTLYALIELGVLDEAKAWRDWLAARGRGLAGRNADHVWRRRRTPADGIRSSAGCRATKTRRPVRIGNAAAGQLQLDVYGEVLDALSSARRTGLPPSEAAWDLECALVEHLEKIWRPAR